MQRMFDLKEAQQQLDELGHRIEARKVSAGRPGTLAAAMQRDWLDIRERHEEIRRKLELGAIAGSPAAETLRVDIDTLRHGFNRWAARTERRYGRSLRP